MESETSALLDSAKQMVQDIENDLAELNILKAEEEYKAQDFSDFTESSLFLNPSDPTVVQQDLVSQISFIRKLKFNYLELNAKGRYVNTIISDVDPNISQQTYDELQASNASEKQLLKEEKLSLAELYREVEQLAPGVSQTHEKLQRDINEVNKLSSEILDAQLELSRLRARHPAPRLSVAKATAIADEQIQKMQALDNEMLALEEEIAEARQKNKDAARELERLRTERSTVEDELQVLQGRGQQEDGRIIELYEWFTTSLEFHKKLLSIESVEHPSANSIQITYTLPQRVTVLLVFRLGTRHLANAQLVNPPPPFDTLDIEDLVAVSTMSGDAKTFLSTLLARLRAQLG